MFDGKDENLRMMVYTLNSGVKLTIPLSTEQCRQWIECFKNRTKFVVQIGEELRGINPELVADFKYSGNLSEYNTGQFSVNNSRTVDEQEEQLAHAYRETKRLFRIECKCGAVYEEKLPFQYNRVPCRDCSQLVFKDVKKGEIESESGMMWLMTNRYFVDRNYTEQRSRGY